MSGCRTFLPGSGWCPNSSRRRRRRARWPKRCCNCSTTPARSAARSRSSARSTPCCARTPPARRPTPCCASSMRASSKVCGVDEAGRGPLAGPVYAAAVILDPGKPIEGLKDSKLLTASKREQLLDQIQARAIAFAIAQASVEEIDELNILHASMLAMQRAVAALTLRPAEAWIDGNRCPSLECRARAFVQGDRLHPVISAASILAKTARDAEMLRLHERYPQYGFDRHKGYPTPQHLALLERHGPCAIHRRSFLPVQRQ